MYILNWIYRYQTEHNYDLISIIGGVTETFFGLFGIALITKSNSKSKKEISIYVLPSAHEQFEKDTKNLLNRKGDAKLNV